MLNRTLLLALLVGAWAAALPAWAGAGPMGADVGWVVDNSGNPLLSASTCTALSQGQTGAIRMEFRLVNGNTTWTTAQLGYYDTVVNTARAAGLQVIGLIDYTSWPGRQSDWCANNYENTSGNGDNSFIDGFAGSAAVPVISHFHDRIKTWEIWNEPNAWTSNPSPGVFTGGSFMYPSNFSQLLANTYADVKEYNNIKDVTILSGGVFGHSIGNVYSYGNAGAQYIDDTYNVGINSVGSFAYTKSHWGTYPLDAVGQHIYIDQGGTTSSGEFQQYISWVRSAYTKYEGTGTTKKTIITEFGWATNNVSQAVQDANLKTAFAVIEGDYTTLSNAIWFSWQDSPGAGLYYGIIDGGGGHKQCYPDYQFWEEYQGYLANGSIDSNVMGYFNNNGGQATLGDPYDNGGSPWVHSWTGGGFSANAQDYSGGSHQRLAVFDSGNGTFEVNDVHGLWDFYLAHGGIAHYGPPQNNEHTSGSGTRQDFLAYYLTWDSTNGVVEHSRQVIAINSGGGAASPYIADTDFTGGSGIYTTTSSIDTSAVPDPAPQAVYQSERWGNLTYTIPGLTAGASYTVRLHFAEIYFNGSGQRKFNVLINGGQVLTNFDIFAAAGGKNKAVVEQFSTQANGSGQIVVQFATGSVNNPKSDGVEVLQ